jgi:hypothetical protein
MRRPKQVYDPARSLPLGKSEIANSKFGIPTGRKWQRHFDLLLYVFSYRQEMRP